MEALRITVVGAVTSFRYPFFVQGVQPTYEMPPPATLYGHIASTLGFLPAPDSFRVAMHFTAAATFIDYEHTHLFGSKQPKLSPFKREILFQPRLTLYIDRPDWFEAFLYPYFVVTLGRSQDLMQYAAVELITLETADSAYVEHTLLPFDARYYVSAASAITMPRWIDETRTAQWGHYAMVRAPQTYDRDTWVDPTAPHWHGRLRAVIWLSFTEEMHVAH